MLSGSASTADGEQPGTSAALPGQAFPPVVYAATIKLPDFWQHGPEPWFQHVEAQFHLWGITVDDMKYYHVVAALDSSTTLRVMGLLKRPAGGGQIHGP